MQAPILHARISPYRSMASRAEVTHRSCLVFYDPALCTLISLRPHFPACRWTWALAAPRDIRTACLTCQLKCFFCRIRRCNAIPSETSSLPKCFFPAYNGVTLLTVRSPELATNFFSMTPGRTSIYYSLSACAACPTLRASHLSCEFRNCRSRL